MKMYGNHNSKRYIMYLNCMVLFQLKSPIFCCWWELNQVLMNHILNRIILLTVKVSLTFVALVMQSDMWPASWTSWFFKFDIISGSHALWTNKVKKKKQHYCFAIGFTFCFCFLLFVKRHLSYVTTARETIFFDLKNLIYSGIKINMV